MRVVAARAAGRLLKLGATCTGERVRCHAALVHSRLTTTPLLLRPRNRLAGIFWPSTTGEPHHLMAFFNSTICLVSATCGSNSTSFSVAALHQVRAADCSCCWAANLDRSWIHTCWVSTALPPCRPRSMNDRRCCSLAARKPVPALQVLGRNDTVTQLDDHTFFVGQRLNGSYAVRVLPTGDAGAVEWHGVHQCAFAVSCCPAAAACESCACLLPHARACC